MNILSKKAITQKLNDNSSTRMITPDMVRAIFLVIIINIFVYFFIWYKWIRECLSDFPNKGFFWYFLTPLVVEIILSALLCLWYKLGESRLDSKFPDSHLYIIVGSLIYSLIIGVIVYYFRSFSFAPLYFAIPLLALTMFRSPHWAAYIFSFLTVAAAVISSNVFEIETYRIDDMPLGADVLFSLHLMLLSGAVSFFVFYSRKNDVEKVNALNDYINNSKKSFKPGFKAPKASILAVDDVNINLMVLKGLVKETEINITTAESGMKAIEYIGSRRFDIIFMDYLMPEPDGLETLRICRSKGDKCPNAETPFIVLTANVEEGAKEDYIANGFADYLAKPVAGEDLERVLLKYLSPDLIEIVSNASH